MIYLLFHCEKYNSYFSYQKDNHLNYQSQNEYSIFLFLKNYFEKLKILPIFMFFIFRGHELSFSSGTSLIFFYIKIVQN